MFHCIRDAAPVPGNLPAEVCPLPALCRREPAWKLRAAFAPVDPERTPVDYHWQVRGIPAPPAAGETQLAETFERPGVSLALDRVIGVGMVRQRVWFPRKPFAVASVKAGEDGLRLSLVRATDDQGRSLSPPRGSGLAPGLEGAPSQTYWIPGQTHHFGLVIPEGAKTLDLTFAVHKARTVEFLARP